MNVNESGNDRRVRAFNILAVIWLVMFIATGVFFPVISVVPKGPALDLLKSAFLVVSLTMLSLAFLIVILVITGVVSMPRTPTEENLQWPATLIAAFLFACVFASGPVSRATDSVSTKAALVQLGVLFILLMLPFVVLAIVAPAIIGRFSSSYVNKVKTWEYIAAVVIGIGIWSHVSDKPLLLMLSKLPPMTVFVIGYLVFLALRPALRRLRGNART